MRHPRGCDLVPARPDLGVNPPVKKFQVTLLLRFHAKVLRCFKNKRWQVKGKRILRSECLEYLFEQVSGATILVFAGTSFVLATEQGAA